MQVFRSVSARVTALSSSVPCVLTIGNFDGLHRGHQSLLERLVAKARALDLPATVMTFEPHPREFFAPEQAPPRLTSLREKLELLAAHGVDRVHVCAFNKRLAAYSAEDFIQQILLDGLAVRHLFVGDDFRFGKGRRGDFAMLQQAGQAQGFGVEAMQTVVWQGERVSSSYVREVLAAGELTHAANLLGRPYAISGRVMHGDKIGRQIGFPTANISLKRKSAPLAGVFAVELTGLDGDHARRWPGAASLGTRPTIAAGLRPVLEVHLLDFDRDIYGTHVTVNFLHKLRDEARFDSLEELTTHIARDVAGVRTYFQNLKNG